MQMKNSLWLSDILVILGTAHLLSLALFSRVFRHEKLLPSVAPEGEMVSFFQRYYSVPWVFSGIMLVNIIALPVC